MIGIDDEIELARRQGQQTLRQLAGQGRLTLRHFEMANTASVSSASRKARTKFWVDIRGEPTGAEGFVISERVYRQLRAMGVPEAGA